MLNALNVNRNILMAKHYSARECAKALDLKYDAFLRKVRRGEIKAKRIGWAVTMTHRQVVEAAKKLCS